MKSILFAHFQIFKLAHCHILSFLHSFIWLSRNSWLHLRIEPLACFDMVEVGKVDFQNINDGSLGDRLVLKKVVNPVKDRINLFNAPLFRVFHNAQVYKGVVIQDLLIGVKLFERFFAGSVGREEKYWM